MSLKAMAWAFDQEVNSSSEKFTLVTLGNFASETGKAYPTVETICRMTVLHHETVRGALKSLLDQGLIKDSGKRVGATQQVKVYQLPDDACDLKPTENNSLAIKDRGGNGERLGKDSGKTRERLGKDSGDTIAEPGTVTGNSKSLKRFTKPTFPEMELYASKMGLPPTEINAFFDHFETNGWKVGRGGLPMRDWQAAMRTWRTNWQTYGNRHNRGGPRENPRNAGIVKGPTDYAAAFKRKAEPTEKTPLAGPSLETQEQPPTTQSTGGRSL